MLVLAALALLLQLQPLVGSVLCFHDAEVAKAECTMPHEGRPADSTLTTPSTGGSGGCTGMAYCAPATAAVPKFTEDFQITSFVYGSPALIDSSQAPDEPAGSLFHPPRA